MRDFTATIRIKLPGDTCARNHRLHFRADGRVGLLPPNRPEMLIEGGIDAGVARRRGLETLRLTEADPNAREGK